MALKQIPKYNHTGYARMFLKFGALLTISDEQKAQEENTPISCTLKPQTNPDRMELTRCQRMEPKAHQQACNRPSVKVWKSTQHNLRDYNCDEATHRRNQPFSLFSLNKVFLLLFLRATRSGPQSILCRPTEYSVQVHILNLTQNWDIRKTT